MRTFCVALAAAAGIAFAAPAGAETRIFLLDGDGGYGIDRCLASGDRCGRAAAAAICRARQFVHAVDFGRVDAGEITGGLPEGKRPLRCEGNSCPQTYAVTCAR